LRDEGCPRNDSELSVNPLADLADKESAAVDAVRDADGL